MSRHAALAGGKRVLYARVPPEIHTGIAEIAAGAQLSASTVIEAILAARMGLDHPHARAVFNAVRTWKGDQT